MADIVTIDCNYIEPNIAAAYLLRCGPQVCLIDNNTNYAVPAILQALQSSGYRKEDVSHIIITHVHLDHAGATGLLLSQCPNAVVFAHPRAATHVIDPSRLVKSAMAVYGEENFKKLYGEIIPVPEHRVYTPSDGETLTVGDRELVFNYTRGHANHHFVIFDIKSNSIFTGDAFGIAYPMLQGGSKPFIFPSTSPTDFDPIEARLAYDKILSSGAAQAYPTHFGVWQDMREGHRMLQVAMDRIERIFDELKERAETGENAYRFAYGEFESYFNEELAARGVQLNEKQRRMLHLDLDLNAQGVVYAAERARKNTKPKA